MATTISEPAGGPADEPTKAPVQTSGDTSGDDDSGDYTHRQILTILSGLLLGMFLAALDQSIVGTAIRTIADDLDGLSIQAWVTTAYLITSTITTPIYGKLGDLYGRKKLFLFAITRVHHRLGAVLVRPDDVRAGGPAGAPGPRRRRPVHPGPGHHRRHRLPA